MLDFRSKAFLLHCFLQDLFLILSKCWFSIGMIVVCFYIFIVNDQGSDIVTAFNEHCEICMSVVAAACMLFAGIENWYGSRLSLNLSDTTILNDYRRSKYAVIIPRILGYLSMVVFYISYIMFNASQWIVDYIILFIPFVIYWFVVVKRRKQIEKWNNHPVSAKYNLLIAIADIKNDPLSFSEITKTGKAFFFLPLIIFPVLITLISLFPVSFPVMCTPTVIILAGIGVWTGIVTAFGVFEEILRIPLLLITVVSLLLFSYLNNNHDLRLTDSEINLENNTDNLKNWYNNTRTDSTKPKTLYIVCGAGGGIRAAYWTASVLASLTDSVPAFSGHLYAMSTVSGSSLGVSAYNSILKHSNSNESFTKQIRNILSEDYLSSITGSFFFNDAFQRFLPFAVKHFDRSRYLEWAWENGWKKHYPDCKNPFSGNMTDLWSNNKRFIPNLFFNSTHTESGRRVVISNLKWNTENWKTKNVFSIVKKNMRLSSSVLLSARFPILTPGAKITGPDNKFWGTMVDGGYYDNYGVITASDLYNDIRSEYDTSQIKVVVLMIQNGSKTPEKPKPLRFASEIRTVPQTFINAWDIKPEKSLSMLGEKLESYGDTVITIELNRTPDDKLPLGWYLSDRAIKIMDAQLNGEEWSKQKEEILGYLGK